MSSENAESLSSHAIAGDLNAAEASATTIEVEDITDGNHNLVALSLSLCSNGFARPVRRLIALGFSSECIIGHNKKRVDGLKFGVPKLSRDEKAVSQALNYLKSKNCVYEHSGAKGVS